jgi:hypothetical protein
MASTSSGWRVWQEDALNRVDEPLRSVLALLPPGPEAVDWILAARWAPSPTAQVLRDWWWPHAARWWFVPGAGWAARPVGDHLLVRYPAGEGNDPVRLASGLGVIAAARPDAVAALVPRLGLALALLAEPLGEMFPFRRAALAAWFWRHRAYPWAARWAGRLGPGDEAAPWGDADPDDVETARACFRAGVPPHRPPGTPPLEPGTILFAAATVAEEPDPPAGLASLATHGIEGAVLERLWRDIRSGAEGGDVSPWS